MGNGSWYALVAYSASHWFASLRFAICLLPSLPSLAVFIYSLELLCGFSRGAQGGSFHVTRMGDSDPSTLFGWFCWKPSVLLCAFIHSLSARDQLCVYVLLGERNGSSACSYSFIALFRIEGKTVRDPRRCGFLDSDKFAAVENSDAAGWALGLFAIAIRPRVLFFFLAPLVACGISDDAIGAGPICRLKYRKRRIALRGVYPLIRCAGGGGGMWMCFFFVCGAYRRSFAVCFE